MLYAGQSLQPLLLLDDSNLPRIPKTWEVDLDTANNRMRATTEPLHQHYSTPRKRQTPAKPRESMSEVTRWGY
jgi:hypothetical protein